MKKVEEKKVTLTPKYLSPCDASDEELLNDLVYWVRVGRNENGLNGDERTYFKRLSKEIAKRKLLCGGEME